MAKVENDIDILRSRKCKYSKTRKRNCINYEKSNSAGWKLMSTSTAIVDTKNQFSNLYLFLENN
ncbi:hypothetical protein [Prochlorococcus marinus]|uniref:hypothetical protein n=1 Tax=Prochlorococcus marinus TaxID=1219 RepID=UPI001FD72F89|nr:hypothetical protein [Prochlorococcus marinus]